MSTKSATWVSEVNAFHVVTSYKKPLSLDDLSEQELAAELEKGYQDILAGRTRLASEVFEELERKYNL